MELAVFGRSLGGSHPRVYLSRVSDDDDATFNEITKLELCNCDRKDPRGIKPPPTPSHSVFFFFFSDGTWVGGLTLYFAWRVPHVRAAR